MATAPERRALLARVADPETMLAVFRAQLPALTDEGIRVTRCSVKPSKSRGSVRRGRLEIVYKVGIEMNGEPEAELVLLGIAPATPALLSELGGRERSLRGHPWAAPFREVAVFLEGLELALLFFPLDPALPGLADLTGDDGARVLAACLPECRAGARIVGLECELAHYKPFDRAVLRVRARLVDGQGAESERSAYAKLFADDTGEASHRDLCALWAASRGSTSLRVPQPLGYDAERRVLVMSEAPGERDLTRWVKCLEGDRPLPAGVDAPRLERCAEAVARALLELQASGVRPSARRTFLHALGQAKKDRDHLLEEALVSRPELMAEVDALLERLQALAPVEEALVPAHGGYRHKQMVGDEHSLTLIDWDGFCLANPALDAAMFLGRLRREPVRRPGSAPELERMSATFRRAFLEGRPEAAGALDLYEGLVLTEQMLRSFRRPGDREQTEREIRCLAAGARELLDRVAARPRGS